MPLAAFSMDPVTAAHLRAIGLPNGPTTAPPDAATTSMGINAALGASPMTNGSQTPPVTPQQNAQLASDTADIFGGMTPPQPQSTAPPAGQAARLQAAQSAMQPTAGQTQQMQDPQANADPMGSMGGQGGTETSPGTTAALASVGGVAASLFPSATPAQRLQAAQAATPQTPPQGAAPDSAASGPSPPLPAAAPGGPSGAPQVGPATTLAATPQEPAQPSPGPGSAAVQQQAPQGLYTPSQIRAALIKQGVPDDDATKLTQISGAESGYGAHPVSGKNANGTTDYGVFQINSVHGDLNPSSLPNADLDTQAAAAAAVYKKEGLGAWTTYKNGAYQKFAGDGQGGGTSTSLGSNSPPGSYSGIDAIKQGAEIGLDPKAMMSLAQSLGYKPIDTDAFNNRNLMAMGMAMMGGRTFADSMKNGAGVMNDSNNAMLGVQEKTNSNALQMAQLGINAKRADAQMALESRRADALDRDRPLGAATLQPDGTYGITMQTPATGATHVVPVGAPAATGVQYLKDNMKQQAELQAEGETGAKNMANFNTLQKLTQDPSTAAGPGIVNELKRSIGTALPGLGIGANASGVQLAQMLTKEFQSDAAGTMRGLGLRNQKEFETFVGQAAKIDTDPAAAAAMAKPMLERSKADYQAWQDWQSQDPQMMSQRLHALNGVNSFRQPYDLQASQTNLATSQQGPTGLAKGARETGAAAAAAAQSSSGYTAPNGISIKFSQ